MSFKVILTTLIAIFIISSLDAQTDPFANSLTASSADTNHNELKANKEEIKDEAVVQVVTAPEIRILQKDKPYQTVLLDARSKDEYSNFKIGSARWIGQDFYAQKIWMLDRKSTIIIYANTFSDEYVKAFCSKMNAMGFEDVRLYSGGIIDWINDGNTVVNNKGRKTTKYKFDNRKLGRLLK